MKNLFLGLTIGICLPLVAGFIFLMAGGMPVATKGPPLPLERTLAKFAIHRAIGDLEKNPSPIAADDINFRAGAKIYLKNCIICHGGIDGEASFIAKGLFPVAPQLLKSDDLITDDPVGKAFWKIKNGIRLTGMPGFVNSLSEVELWQVSLMLVNADKLSNEIKQTLSEKGR